MSRSEGATREQVAINVVRVTTENGRYYEVIEGGRQHKLPSVTTVMKCIAKGQGLMTWLENQGRDGAIKAAQALYSELIKGGGRLPSPTDFGKLAKQRIPRQRESERSLAKANEIGTYAHALVEHDLKQQLGIASSKPQRPEVKENAEAGEHAYESQRRWAESVKLRPISIEETIYSIKRRRIAGTLDTLAYVEDKRKVVDWKTGKSIYGEAFLQNAVYQDAWEEMGNEPVEGGVIVRLPKNIGDPAFEAKDVPEREGLLRTFDGARALWEWWDAEQKRTEEAFQSRFRRKAA